MNEATYRAAKHARRMAVSDNASRRMRGLPALPLPPIPEAPMGWEIFDAEGVYAGFTMDEDEAREHADRLGGRAQRRKPNWA